MCPIQQNREPQIPGRDTTPANDGEVIENLMHTHDVFISTLRSRLTKLQVIFAGHLCLYVIKADSYFFIIYLEMVWW